MAKIELTGNEALVLIDFLIRFSNEEKLTIEDPAEKQILWDLCAMLESQVPELLDSNYKILLQKARQEIAKEIE
jgi:hypothetical protein